MASSSFACPRSFAGQRLEQNASFAYRRIHQCGDRPGYTCCGRENEVSIARSDASCREVAGSPSCCEALRPLRCYACDGAAQLGIVTGIAPALCTNALIACGDTEVSVDAIGTATFCGPDSLLCSPARDIFPGAEDVGEGSSNAAGIAFCQSMGFPVAQPSGASGGGPDANEGSGVGLPKDLTDESDDADASGAHHQFDGLADVRARGYVGFPTALDSTTSAALEKAIARAAREREAAASAAAAADLEAGRFQFDSPGAFVRRFGSASAEPLTAILLAILAVVVFAYRRQINRGLRQMVLGKGAAKSRLSPSDLRAARLAFQRAARQGGGSESAVEQSPHQQDLGGPALRAAAPADDSDSDSGKES